MSNYKNFGIAGVGSSVQLGKSGGVVSYSPSVSDGSASGVAPAFSFFDKTAQSLVRVQTGAPLHISDAATKLYVDNAVQGLNIKAAVAVASAGQNVALSGNAPLSIDGVQVTTGERVLLKDQTDATQNGIYTVTVSGSSYTLARSADASNTGEDASKTSSLTGGSFTFVTSGSSNADTGWVLSAPEGTVNIGTDHISFTQFSSAGVAQAGAGLAKNGQVFSAVVDGKTIHTNNGALAVQGTSTSGQVLLSDGSGNAQWGSLNLSNVIGSSTVSVENGGTGLSSVKSGDLLVGAANNKIANLGIGTANQILTTDGTTVKWADPAKAAQSSAITDASGNVRIDTDSSSTGAGKVTVSEITPTGTNQKDGSSYSAFIANSGVQIKANSTSAGANTSLVLSAGGGDSAVMVDSAYYNLTASDWGDLPNEAVATVGGVNTQVRKYVSSDNDVIHVVPGADTLLAVNLRSWLFTTENVYIDSVKVVINKPAATGTSGGINIGDLAIAADSDIDWTQTGTYVVESPLTSVDKGNGCTIAGPTDSSNTLDYIVKISYVISTNS